MEESAYFLPLLQCITFLPFFFKFTTFKSEKWYLNTLLTCIKNETIFPYISEQFLFSFLLTFCLDLLPIYVLDNWSFLTNLQEQSLHTKKENPL